MKSRQAKPLIGLAPAFEALKPYSITVINGEVFVDFDSGQLGTVCHLLPLPTSVEATRSTFERRKPK